VTREDGASPSAPEASGKAEHSLLVVIDMQRFFTAGEPWATPGFEDLIDPIGALADGFGERVVFTRFLVPEQPQGSWQAYYRMWPQVTGPAAAPLAELVPPWTGRPTLDAPTFSKWGPPLADRLGDHALVLCGVSSDCCVLATAVAAADAGASVRVVADACAGLDAAAHERALALLAGFAPQIEISSVAAELAAR
jgi:nicotinamidase-related amidase